MDREWQILETLWLIFIKLNTVIDWLHIGLGILIVITDALSFILCTSIIRTTEDLVRIFLQISVSVFITSQ